MIKYDFNRNNNNNYQEFKASGLLIRTKIHNDNYYLMSFEKKRGLWSDLGGKRDSCDKSILETAIREFNEETNQLFFETNNNNKRDNNNKLQWKTNKMINEYCIKKIRNYHSKYMIYILDIPLYKIPWLKKYQNELNSLKTDSIPEKIRKITNEYFGEIEKQNGLFRQLSFISEKEFSQYQKERKINPRLYCRFLSFF